MNKLYSKRILLILTGCFLWTCYFFDDKLSRFGMYICESYKFHEILSIIPRISIAATALWIICLTYKTIKKRKCSSDIFFSIVLILLLVFQGNYLNTSTKSITTTEIATVISLNEQNHTVVISSLAQERTLTCPEFIFNLLENKKKYLFTYEWREEDFHKGRLNTAIVIK